MHTRRYPRWLDLLIMLTIVPALLASVAAARAEGNPASAPHATVSAAHINAR